MTRGGVVPDPCPLTLGDPLPITDYSWRSVYDHSLLLKIMKGPLPLQIGDTVQMRKQHPCGGDHWQIVRIGADIGMRCLTCGRKVLLPRAECERRIKRIVATTPSDPQAPESSAPALPVDESASH